MLRPLVLAAFGLLVAACGGAGALDGTVTISGSTTLLPMMSLVGGDFAEEHPLVRLNLDAPGTADGFALFCDGLVHINNASRRIAPREAEACAASGVRFVELPVAADAIVLFTSPANPIECLSLHQVYALVGPEAGDVHRWSDAEALAEKLGEAPARRLPSTPFRLVGSGAESGTRATFVELAVAPTAEARNQVADLRSDYTALQGNALILAEALRDASSLGFAGFPTVGPWGSQVKRLGIDNGSGCSVPDEAGIGSGEYPLTRVLYVYVNLDAAARRPAVDAFVRHLLSDDGLAGATGAGSVPLTRDQARATRALWDGAR